MRNEWKQRFLYQTATLELMFGTSSSKLRTGLDANAMGGKASNTREDEDFDQDDCDNINEGDDEEAEEKLEK